MRLMPITRNRIHRIEKSDCPFVVVAQKDSIDYFVGSFADARSAVRTARETFQSDKLNVTDARVFHISDVSKEY